MLYFDGLLSQKSSVAVIGLGYVGLPLVVALAGIFPYRICYRCRACRGPQKRSRCSVKWSLATSNVRFTRDPAVLMEAGVIIMTVPTPVDSHHTPDLSPVVGASRTVGRHMSKGCVVCYESIVYPGVTEDECIPILAEESGLRFPEDFTVGYSPECINLGDMHRLETIRKVVAGCDAATADLLVQVYGSVGTAGIHRASSIQGG